MDTTYSIGWLVLQLYSPQSPCLYSVTDLVIWETVGRSVLIIHLHQWRCVTGIYVASVTGRSVGRRKRSASSVSSLTLSSPSEIWCRSGGAALCALVEAVEWMINLTELSFFSNLMKSDQVLWRTLMIPLELIKNIYWTVCTYSSHELRWTFMLSHRVHVLFVVKDSWTFCELRCVAAYQRPFGLWGWIGHEAAEGTVQG